MVRGKNDWSIGWQVVFVFKTNRIKKEDLAIG
jgi:hypothetical protein